MKKIYLIALLALMGGGWLQAQTNANAAPRPSRAANAMTRIDSDRAEFDLAARRAVYQGNVRVDDPQMQLTCEQLTADLPQSGGHINHLVALTNVVMDSVDDKGQTNHATSDKAVYNYDMENGVTNETITLTGNAKVKSGQDWMTGEPIVWNRANNSIHVENVQMILHQNSATTTASTNPPVTQTNLPAAKTNFPPGTISNIDLMTLPQSGPTTTH